MVATAEERRVVERARDDPNWWVKNVLGGDPWEIQREILDAMLSHKRTAVASCHGAGKSWVAARVVMWFLYNYRPSIVITTAPTDRQVEGILWKEIRVAHKRAIYEDGLGGECLTKKLRLDDDWLAWGFTAPDYDPDRFQGFHEENILVVVDEASGVSRMIYDGIEGMLSSANAKLLMIGNPTDPLGYFAKAFKKASVAKFHISAFDTPNFTEFGITETDIAERTWKEKITGPLPNPSLVTPEWVDDKYHEAWGPSNPLYISRVKGEFPTETDGGLIPLSWAERAQNTDLEPKPEDILVLGGDVARDGDDETVCYERRGPRARLGFHARKEDTMQTTGRFSRHLKDTEAARAMIDSIGIGAGVCDRLRELGHEVYDVIFGAKPDDTERFANLKAELYWHVRQLMEDGLLDLDPDDDLIVAQATSVRWQLTSAGKIAIEPKEQMKSRGVKSPDRFEALVYAFAESPRFTKRQSYDIDLSEDALVRPSEWRVK